MKESEQLAKVKVKLSLAYSLIHLISILSNCHQTEIIILSNNFFHQMTNKLIKNLIF